MALIAAIGITTVLAISGTTVAFYASSAVRSTNSSRGGQTAYTLAEAAMNDALSVLSNAPDPRVANLLPGTTVNMEGGTATYSGTINASYVWTLTAVGQVRNANGTKAIKSTLHRSVTVRGINDGADGSSWSRFYQDSTGSCLTIDSMTFVTKVATRGNLCLRNSGAITGASTIVDVGGTVSITGPDTSAGPRVPTAASGTSWTSPTNVYTSNNTYATYSVAAGGTSNALSATGFGFTIPSTAIIRGIEVSIERKAGSANTLKDEDVYIKKASCTDPCGSDRADTGTYYGTSDSSDNHGSSSDLWGTTLTAADINSSSFGVYYRIHNYGGSSVTASIDQITVTVTYSADTNGIGTAGTPIAEAHITGTCTYNAQAAHTPCSCDRPRLRGDDHRSGGREPTAPRRCRRSTSTTGGRTRSRARSTSARTRTPASPRTSSTTTPAPPAAPNGSIMVNGEMAPATSDYTARSGRERAMLRASSRGTTPPTCMDINGTIFIDGNFRFDEDGEIIHYYGRANIMSSQRRRDRRPRLRRRHVRQPDATRRAASSNMASWDESQNMMVLMSADAERVRPGRHDVRRLAAELLQRPPSGRASRGSSTRRPTA